MSIPFAVPQAMPKTGPSAMMAMVMAMMANPQTAMYSTRTAPRSDTTRADKIEPRRVRAMETP